MPEQLETQIAEIARLWSGADHPALGTRPAPGAAGGPPVVLGGHSPAAMDRAARLAQGWIAGGAGPDAFGHGARALMERWRRNGRSDPPRRLSLAYYVLGDDAERVAERYIGDYYASAGPFAQIALERLTARLTVPVIAEGRIRTPEQARAALDAGAWCVVVVGGAITRPVEITLRFTEAL